jgi:hypothetical protein
MDALVEVEGKDAGVRREQFLHGLRQRLSSFRFNPFDFIVIS